MSTIAELLVTIGADATDFQRGFDAVQAKLDQASAGFSDFTSNLGSVEKVLDAMASKFTAAGIAMTAAFTIPLVSLGKSSLDAAAEMDSLNRALTVTAGSADGAAAQMARLQELAKLPGVDLKDAVQMSLQFQQAGFSAQRAEQDIQLFGNALALVGRSGPGQLAGVLLQFRQLLTTEFPKQQDLQPLTNRLPQVSKILSDSFNGATTAGELKAMGVTSAEVAATIEKAFAKMGDAGDNAKNQIENVHQAWFQIEATLGKAEFPFLKVFANDIIPQIQKVADAFAKLPESAQTWIVGVAAALALLGPVLLGLAGGLAFLSSMIGLFTSMELAPGVIAGLSTAMVGLGSALNGLVTAPIVAITAGFAAFTEGGIVAGITAAAGALAGLAGPIAIVAVAIGTLFIGFELYQHWSDVKNLLVALWTDLGSLWGQEWNGIKDFLTGVWVGIQAIVGPIWTPIVIFFSTIWTGVGGAFQAAWSGITDFLRGVWGGISVLASTIWGGIVAQVKGAIDWLAQALPNTARALSSFGSGTGSGEAGTEGSGLPTSGTDLSGEGGLNLLPLPTFARIPQGSGKILPATGRPFGDLIGLEMVKQLTAANKSNAAEIAHARILLSWGWAGDDPETWLDKNLKPLNLGEPPIIGATNSGANFKSSTMISDLGLTGITMTGVKEGLDGIAQYDAALKTLGVSHHATADQIEAAWVQVRDSSISSSREKLEAERAYLNAVGQETGDLTTQQRERLGEINAILNKQAIAIVPVWQQVSQQVNRTFDQMERGLADSIVHWKGFGDTITKVFQDLASGILTIFLKRLLAPLQDALTNILLGDSSGSGGLLGGLTSGIGKALGGLFGGGSASGGGGIGKALGGIFGGGSQGGGIFSALGGLFGGGGSGEVAIEGSALPIGIAGDFGGEITGAVSSVAGSAGGFISSALGMAGSLFGGGGGSSIIDAVTGIGSWVSQMHANTALGRIEESTRFTQIRTANMEQLALTHWPKLTDIHERLFEQIAYWAHLMETTEQIRDFLDPTKQLPGSGAGAAHGAGGTLNAINGVPIYFVTPDASSLDRLMQLFAAYMTGQPA